MKAVTFSDARKNLRTLIRTVCETSEPVIIVHKESTEKAVLISLEDYRNLQETAYLILSPPNRTLLGEALRQICEENDSTAPFPSKDL